MDEDNYWDNQDYEDYSSGSNTFDGYSPGGDNSNLNDSYGTGNYNGYTPGYDNPNLDTSYGNNDWNSGYNYQPNGQVQSSPEILQTPQWYPSTANTPATNPATSYGGWTPTATPAATNPMGQAAAPNNFGTYASGITQALAQLFSNNGKTNPLVQVGGALATGAQNKQMASQLNTIAQNPTLDPFGQANRQFYQQQAQQATTNPYDSPIVKAQIEQLQRAQNAKDAAAGRRSNSLTSDPAVMAEMAKIAMQYQSQMANQGGAGMAPQGGTIADLQSQAAKYNTNGYVSPLANAIGYNSQSNNNSDTINNLLTALNKFKSQE